MDPQLAEYLDNAIQTRINVAIQPYLELIDELRATILEKDLRIKELEDQLAATKPTNPPPSTPNVNNRIDDLEQRSRSWNVRISGAKLQPDQSTDQVVIDIAKSMGVKLDKSDIDWSHRISKPSQEKGQQIIVRFLRRNDRAEFIKARRKLREPNHAYSSVYISEDLTRARYSVLRQLIALRREKKIFAAWSFQGSVFYKTKENDRPSKIMDISAFSSDQVITEDI